MVDLIIGSSERFLLNHRLFNVVTFCGVIIAVLMFFSDLSMGLGPKFYFFSFMVTVAFTLLYIEGRKNFNFEKFIWPLIIIGYITVLYVWQMLGGITGASLVIALSFLIPISILLSGIQKYLALSGFFVIVTGVSIAEIIDPQIVYAHATRSQHLMDFFISAIFVGIGIVLFISLAMRSYYEQHEKMTSITRELASSNTLLKIRNDELERALSEIRELKEILPICSSCKKIRDDEGHWWEVDAYFQMHMDARFSHGVCPQCCRELYPDLD